MLREFVAFWVPFLAAVLCAILAIWAIMTVIESGGQNLSGGISLYDLKIMSIIGICVGMIGLVPCALAVHITERDGSPPNSIAYGKWGLLTGVASISLGLIATSSLNFGDIWMWRSLWQRSYLIPTCAVSGLLAGGLFGLLRKRIL